LEPVLGGNEDRPHADTYNHMYNSDNIIEYCEVYTVGPRDGVAIPFVHMVEITGRGGSRSQLLATFDGCAMVNVIDSKAFARLGRNLLGVQRSAKVLRMANGFLVPSEAT
jgi:hypothetical protein